MSNDLASMLSYLDHEEYDSLVEYLDKPPPSPDEALAVHVGRSRSRLIAFFVACSILSEADRKEVASRLSSLVLAAQKRGHSVSPSPHMDEALGDLLDLAKPLLDA